ncbi:unnamed protein product [Fusarium graminearum]|nr:unnamed protein product [Fusarium graminearum]
MARIYQTVRSVPRRKNTIQFFYHLTSGGDCTVAARLGGSMFWSAAASRDAGSWVKVLGQVEASDSTPTFDVSLTCSGAGSSSILVDSIFISDKVTPDTIGSGQLDFGSVPVPIVTTAIEPTSRTARTTDSRSANTANASSTTSWNEASFARSTEMTMGSLYPVIETTLSKNSRCGSTDVTELKAERSPSVTDNTSNSYTPTIVDPEIINRSTSDGSTEVTMEGSLPVTGTTGTKSDAATFTISEDIEAPSDFTTTRPSEGHFGTTKVVDQGNDTPASKTTTAEPAELTGCSATCTLIEDYQ